METQATDRSKQQKLSEFYKKLFKLTIGGGLAFWVTTIAISLTPIRAEFRAALSMSYVQSVLVEGLIGSLIIGFFVSFFLLRFFDKIPTKNPILKSVILSFVPYVINLILLGVAASHTSDAQYIFLIGAVLQVPSYLALGIVIGYLYKRLYGLA
jgi:hypothetical protein